MKDLQEDTHVLAGRIAPIWEGVDVRILVVHLLDLGGDHYRRRVIKKVQLETVSKENAQIHICKVYEAITHQTKQARRRKHKSSWECWQVDYDER